MIGFISFFWGPALHRKGSCCPLKRYAASDHTPLKFATHHNLVVRPLMTALGATQTSKEDDPARPQRFRDSALPHLDAAYTLARYLLRDPTDAEDAVQECYLRALKHFDGYRGPAMKPWLFAILRNVCRAEFARRAASPSTTIEDSPEATEQTPLWHEEQETPEAQMLRDRDAVTI